MRGFSHLTFAKTALALGSLWLVGASVGSAIAQELRIETDVFADDGEESLAHTVTLFDANTVYDFSDHPARVVVFRSQTPSRIGQFIVLDIQTQKRTEISTDRIEALIDKVSRWSAEQKDPLLKFSASPEFKEEFDSQNGVLDLTSEVWSYHVATIPAESTETLSRFKEFTDWYAKLNSMMSNTAPPGPRLALNGTLEKHGVLPVEIRRTLSDGDALRAVHLVTWRLSRADRARLEEARRMLSTFEKVSNEEFAALSQDGEDVRGQSLE